MNKLTLLERENKELRKRVFELEHILIQRREFNENQSYTLRNQLYRLNKENSTWIAKLNWLEKTIEEQQNSKQGGLNELLVVKSYFQKSKRKEDEEHRVMRNKK